MIILAMGEFFTVASFMQERFSGYGYVLLTGNQAPVSAVTNFAAEWHEKYFEEEFFRIDPVFKFSAKCGLRSSAMLLSHKDMASALFEEARGFGADSNFISVSHFGGNRMIFGGVNHDLDRRAVSAAHLECRKAHRQILVQKVPDLTDTQLDLLDLSEEGLLDKQIAIELGISVSAVAQRKKVICAKIGVTSFPTAVSLYSTWKWGGLTANP